MTGIEALQAALALLILVLCVATGLIAWSLLRSSQRTLEELRSKDMVRSLGVGAFLHDHDTLE